jgi:hypothetical protein
MSKAPDDRTRTGPVYPSTEWLKQRRATFTGMVVRAAHGKAEPLRDYFRHGPRQLSEDDCDDLVWLIEEKLLRRDGRPPGSFKPTNAALEYTYCLLRVATQVWCDKHGFKRASRKGPNKAPRDEFADRAIALTLRQWPKERGKIDRDAVLEFKSKLTRDERKKLKYVLPEDIWEMEELALK